MKVINDDNEFGVTATEADVDFALAAKDAAESASELVGYFTGRGDCAECGEAAPLRPMVRVHDDGRRELVDICAECQERKVAQAVAARENEPSPCEGCGEEADTRPFPVGDEDGELSSRQLCERCQSGEMTKLAQTDAVADGADEAPSADSRSIPRSVDPNEPSSTSGAGDAPEPDDA